MNTLLIAGYVPGAVVTNTNIVVNQTNWKIEKMNENEKIYSLNLMDLIFKLDLDSFKTFFDENINSKKKLEKKREIEDIIFKSIHYLKDDTLEFSDYNDLNTINMKLDRIIFKLNEFYYTLKEKSKDITDLLKWADFIQEIYDKYYSLSSYGAYYD
ncbi:hypothetical protein [[Mycoplasma] gypis]|uniref:Uncharacterized protein n=1 Tax=[Mycoplasma] gypis TaxID=92404 RepID=A0ABZ2RQB4_9BACT|nr:hypothetical protein [[Mycoplasma] gypis]MBN0919673.1 hypothetical protein [[Mycoplasma] gypis]